MTPPIFLVRILIAIFKSAFNVLFNGVLNTIIGPILWFVGMTDITASLQVVINTVGLLLDSVSCMLAKLAFFSSMISGCDSSGSVTLPPMSTFLS